MTSFSRSEVSDTSDAASDHIDPTIQCSACEAVCCRLKVVLQPGDRVPTQYIDQDERGLSIMAKGEDGWCAAMDANSMRCTIYAQRPRTCRDFDMGGSACREERLQWYQPPKASTSSCKP